MHHAKEINSKGSEHVDLAVGELQDAHDTEDKG
jgi:hypothetical protein